MRRISLSVLALTLLACGGSSSSTGPNAPPPPPPPPPPPFCNGLQGDWVSYNLGFDIAMGEAYGAPPYTFHVLPSSTVENSYVYAGSFHVNGDTTQLQITATVPIAHPDSVIMDWVLPDSPALTAEWRGTFVGDSVVGTLEAISRVDPAASFSMVCSTP